jgi:hypothetical protein
MKTISVNVQITKCPKQYEAVRLGVEVTLEPGENEADAIKTADQFLREQYAALYGEPLQAAKPVPAAAPNNPKPAQGVETKTAKEPPASDKRERLEFSDKRVQQIVKRMEAQPGRAKEILEQTLKYFDPTEEVMKTLNLAAKLV